jgi:hypothetical protein
MEQWKWVNYYFPHTCMGFRLQIELVQCRGKIYPHNLLRSYHAHEALGPLHTMAVQVKRPWD